MNWQLDGTVRSSQRGGHSEWPYYRLESTGISSRPQFDSSRPRSARSGSSRSEEIHPYRDHFSCSRINERTGPIGGGGPASVEQVQAVVRTANVQGAAVRDFHRQEFRLRRSCAERSRQRHRRPEADEPRSSRWMTSGISHWSSPASPTSTCTATSRSAGSRSGSTRRMRDGARLMGNALDHGIGYTLGLYRDHAARTTAWRSCCPTAN